MSVMGIMFICKYSAEEEINMGDMFSGAMDDETLARFYKNENFLKSLETVLPLLEARGYLDRVVL
jgi:hypothetical protein